MSLARGMREEPPQQSSGERADYVATELQAAGLGGASDAQRVSALLSTIRQFAEKGSAATWPPETTRKLWQSILGALRNSHNTEVQIAACAAVETLGQNCSSCTDLEREPTTTEEAVSCVVETISSSDNRQVLVAAVKALLSLTGCLNCRCYYDKPTQEVLGSRGAVEALLIVLVRVLGDGTDGGLEGHPHQDSSTAVVADIFRALHYTCLLNPANTARLIAAGGCARIHEGLDRAGKDLNVQEHGAMLLAEMAASPGPRHTHGQGQATPGLGPQEVLVCVATVASIARLQLQDKYIEVARSAVWSLGRLASACLGASPTAAAAAASPEQQQLLQQEAWRLLSGQVLHVVVTMLMSCHLQDDPLVKHCLDYITIIASAAPLHRVHSPAGADASSSSASSHESGSSDPEGVLPTMRMAAEAVVAAARSASEGRSQAVVLRTLHVLLLRFPGAVALQLQQHHRELLERALSFGSAARLQVEQQVSQHGHGAGQGTHGSAPQAHGSVSHGSKDLFLVQLYGLTVAGALTDSAVFGPDVRTALHNAVDTVLTPTAAALAGVSPGVNGGSTPFLNSVSVLQAHVLGCMAGIVRHLAEAGDGVSYDESAGPGVRLGVGCCRYACHCCFIHDSVRGADVLAAVRAVASLLALGGGADGVNATDRDGCGVLHLLAVSGMAPLLAAYIAAAGPGLDFLRRTRAGSNALQMARSRKHAAAVEMLELATETAAKAAQDALLKELEAEGAQEPHAPGGGKRSGSASSTGTITGRGGAAAGAKAATGLGDHAQQQQQQQQQQPPVAPDSEEARRARDELERKRRAAEEEYEAALELRRRQLEEEARQAAAEEARLIELAQQESLRLATPPPDAEQQQQQKAQDSSGPRASDGGAEFEDQQAATAAALAGLGAGEDGSLEASLQAAAMAMASGAPLPPSLAHILAQIAEQQQQPQPQQARQPPQVPQPQPVHAPTPMHAPAPVAVQSLAASEAVRGGVSLSSLDEQVTMPPGGQSPGTAQGMQRVVSRQDLHAPQHDAGAASAAIGGGGLPGGSARFGAYGQPFTGSLMQQQQQEQQQASVGMSFEAGNGGIRAPVPSRGGSDSMGSSFEGGLPPALQQQLQQQQQQQASGGFQPGAWPGNQNHTYPSGPSGFLTNALGGGTGSGGTGAPQQGGMLTSSSSNFLSQQAAQSDTWLSHQAQGQQQQQQQQQQLFGPGGAMTLQGPGSGPEPPRGLQPSLHEALAAPQEQMWELAEEPTRGPSRQLWMGNVQGGLPPGHLQALCQQFGPVQDVVMAPGTLSAVVLFANAQDASRCAHALHGRDIPHMSYDNKPLVVRYCSTSPGSAAGDHAGGTAAAANAGAGADSASGLPPAIEAALAAAGFGPAAINAAMQGVLPPEQQQAFHAALLQASMAPPPAAAPPPPRVQQQPHALASRALGIGLDQLGGIGGSMPELAALHAVLAGGYSTGTDRQGGGGGGLFGGGGEGGVAASDADSAVGGSANGEGEGLGGAGGPGGGGDAGEVAADVPEGKPSRHLWLGNIPLKPNKLAMELLFARFGPLESVRVFPGKTFAFVNYLSPQHAVAAKMALDGQPAPSVTGSKPMVIRYQKDTSTVPANLGVAGGKSMSRSSSTNNLTGLSAAASLARLLDEDLPPEPAVNLSNKLNPNNIHYDRELAARYKRMSKAEKEALWAQDRAMQALGANAAAAAAAVNAGVPGGIAGLLDPTNAAAARLLAQAGLGGLAAGLSGGAGSEFLLPRVMSTGALDYLAASTGHAAHNAAAAAAVGGGHGGAAAAGGGHGGLFRVNTTQSLLGMQQAANAMLLPQMSGGLGGGLDANAVAAQALQQQLQAQQQALQQQLQQQALQQQLQQLTGAGGNHALLNNLAMSQALAGLGLGGPGAAGSAGPAGTAGLRGPGAPGVQAPGGGSSLDWASLQAALANLGLGGGAPGAPQAAATPQSAALAALLQQQQQPPLSQAQQRLQQQQQFGGGTLAAAFGDGAGRGGAGGGPGGPGAAGLSLHGPPVPPRRVSQTHSGRALNVGGPQAGMGGLNAAMMDPAAAAALAASGGLPGLSGGGAAGLVPPGAGGLGAPGGAAGRPAMSGPLGGGFKQLPPSFLCPLTRQLLSDPVVAADGITYNRPAIAEWLRSHDSSPVTRQPLANKMLTPNVALRNAIMAELGFGPQA